MFPELREKIGNLFGGRPPIQTLDLKAAGVGTFGLLDVDYYRKFPQIFSILSGGMPAWSGEAVSVESALNHSVVYACNKIVSESIGLIPAVMLQTKGKAKEPAERHPMYNALIHAPNDEITAQGFTEMLTSHCLLLGGGFAQIVRRSGTNVAIEMRSLLPSCVLPDREKSGQKRLVYIIKENNQPDKTFTLTPGKPQDILHLRGLGFDGVRGFSVITLGRQSVGTAIAAERNAARFWANGGRVPYLLEMINKFKTDEDFQRFRNEWERVYSEPHRAPILESGTKYIQTGLNMRDAQALESRQYTIAEICRWFSVSPHLVGDLSRATFSNIEQLALEFVKMTLASWMTRWEEDLWRCVLTPDEKSQGYTWRHDDWALLRGDFKTRMEGYASALQNGHMNVDQVRERESLNPIPGGGGQTYHFQMNLQTTPGTGEQTVVEQGILARATAPTSSPAIPKE